MSLPNSYTDNNQSGFTNPLYENNYDPNATSPNYGNIAAGLGGAMQAAGTIANVASDFMGTSEFNVDDSIQQQTYNPRSAPPVYIDDVMPDEIAEGTGGRAALNYAGQGLSTGASIGSMIAPGIGTAIGAGIGAIGGAVTGALKGKQAKMKREQFESKRDEKRRKYSEALNNYYNIQNQIRTQEARQQQLNQRSQPIAPMFGANIYGIGNY